MANVMQKSIQIDEENMAKEQELMARLATENKVGPIKKPMLTRYVLIWSGGIPQKVFLTFDYIFHLPIELSNSGGAEASNTPIPH